MVDQVLFTFEATNTRYCITNVGSTEEELRPQDLRHCLKSSNRCRPAMTKNLQFNVITIKSVGGSTIIE